MSRNRDHAAASTKALQWSIWILAGGQSRRMGRDKSRIRLAGKSLLAHVRSAAESTGWPVRVIRKDAVTRCGPLGGMLTALQRSRSDWNLFLSCDQPLLSVEILERLMNSAAGKRKATFVRTSEGFGFPCVIAASNRSALERLVASGKPSLQRLAGLLGAQALWLPRRLADCLTNINTPAELAVVRRMLLRARSA